MTVQTLFSIPTPFTPPTTEEDRLSWLRLIRSRRVGISTFFRLLTEHGSAAAALDALPGVARAAGLADYAPCTVADAMAEVDAAHAASARMICFGTPDYPAQLADIADPPPLLWCRGDAALLARPMVAMVGARNASSLGVRMARRLADSLGAAGFVVVSGLARGIDAAAHAAALECGTVAVLAGGVDRIYPPENADLAARIAETGALVSEAPIGAVAQARHFPARNRIVSGMARGVVVVEAAARSGSLITARDALDQGREVMAVPGHPMDARAAGCNALIRDGAILVRDASDVLAALPPVARVQSAPPSDPLRSGEGQDKPAKPAASPSGASARTAPAQAPARWPAPASSGAPEPRSVKGARTDRKVPRGAKPADTPAPRDPSALPARILACLTPAAMAEDQVIRDLNHPPAEVLPVLLALEMDGLVERRPGGTICLGPRASAGIARTG